MLKGAEGGILLRILSKGNGGAINVKASFTETLILQWRLAPLIREEYIDVVDTSTVLATESLSASPSTPSQPSVKQGRTVCGQARRKNCQNVEGGAIQQGKGGKPPRAKVSATASG
jgi:hypothetical protein